MSFSSLATRIATSALILFLIIPAFAQDATRTRLIAASPSHVGQPVTIVAEVDSLGGDRPTGVVSFTDGATALGSAPLSVLGAGQATLSTSGNSTCALSDSGGVNCWGEGFHYAPGPISGLTSGVVTVARRCGVTDLGGVKCFHNNTSITDFPLLSSGVVAFDGCALTTAGAVKCWGESNAYDLGYCCAKSATPGAAASSSAYTAVVSGNFHKCALTNVGGVECWGWGGLVGDGTTEHRTNPVPVVGLSSGVVALAAGYRHTCAVTVAGAVKCWGGNFYGEIGDGTKWNGRLTPVQVSGLTSGIVAVAAGDYYTCALSSVGEVRCWGHNVFGQLGDGTAIDRLTPKLVSNLGGVGLAISAGANHTCALLATSRALRCWGFNSYGQLGDGTNTTRLVPTAVVGATGVLRTRARLTISTLGAGWHMLRASYAGDAGHTGSSDVAPQGVQ